MNRAKRFLALVLVAVMMVSLIPDTAYAATKKKASVKSVTITKPDTKVLVLKKKQTFKLKTKVTVTGKASKKVKYSSSNKKVATVNSAGKIKAVKNGTAKITVKSVADSKKKATLKVIVGTPVTKVTLDKTTAEGYVGDKIELKATVTPASPSVKPVDFESSDDEVATVDDNGVVTCVAEGNVTITSKATDGNSKKATCKVTVKKKEEAASTTEQPTTAATTTEQQQPEGDKKPETPTKPDPGKEDPTPEKPVMLDTTDYDLSKPVFEDEFEGDTLNTNLWNYEQRGVAYVNSELQEYVSGDGNKGEITVKDGKLTIQAKKSEDEKLSDPQFADPAKWELSVSGDAVATVTYTSGEATTEANIAITNPGANSKDIQFKSVDKFAIDEKYQYKVSLKAVSDVDRSITVAVFNGNSWFSVDEAVDAGVSGKTVELKANEPQDIVFYFRAKNKATAASFVVDLGKLGESASSANITLSKVSVKKQVISSGRINTTGKPNGDLRYGLFEASIKVPEGNGYLPAFWLLGSDEDGLYGQWPRCGEIDIMEVLGYAPDQARGTIHYGSSSANQKENQGIKTLDKGKFSDSFHKFSCEWLPGEIRWYVDDVMFYKTNDWYTSTDGVGEISYPAPFDSEFYIILNLAVGGSWVGYPDETTSFGADNNMVVEYVKVYQKESYDENVEKPVKEVIYRDPDTDGNYIANGKFTENETHNFENTGNEWENHYWQLHTEPDAEAEASIVSDEKLSGNALKIETKKAGKADYGVQPIQPGIPLINGTTYKLSFDAYAESARTMSVALKGPDNGFSTYYSSDVELASGEAVTHFEKTFKMDSAHDANSRLEFNLGKTDNPATVYITNVKLTVESGSGKPASGDAKKTVLGDGNYVYNGTFDKGLNPKFLADWDIDKGDAAISVTDLYESKTDKKSRRLKVVIPEGSDKPVKISQSGLAVASGNSYELTFDVEGTGTLAGTVMGQAITDDKTGSAVTLGDNRKVTMKINLGDLSDADKKIEFIFSGVGTYYLDNVRLVEDALIKNGDFSAGKAGYEWWAGEGGAGKFAVDSIESGHGPAADCTITNTGTDDWQAQLKQVNVPLEKDHYYKLSFNARSTVNRKIKVIMQGKLPDSSKADGFDYPVYSGENIVELTSEWKQDSALFTKYFKMEYESDPNAYLSICLGTIAGEDPITTEHHVYIDDISLVEIDANDMPAAPTVAEKEYNKNLFVNSEMTSGDAWVLVGEDLSSGNAAAVENGKATFTVESLGDTQYAVELKQENLTLEKGEYYVLSFTIESSIARKVQAKFQQNGGDWTPYFSADIDLTSGNAVKYESKEFNMIYDSDDKALFAIDMGIFDNTQLDPHTIEISELSYKKVHHTATEPAETLNVNKLTLADVDKTILNTDKQDKIYNMQAAQNPVSMVAGYTYKISFTITSAAARTVECGVQKGSGDYATYPNASKSIDLNAGVETPVEFEFVMPATDEAAQFFINYAKKDALGTVSIKNISMMATAAPSDNLLLSLNAAINGDVNLQPPEAANISSKPVTDGFEYTISNVPVGLEEWHVRIENNGLKIDNGKTYKLSFDIECNHTRKIKYGVQLNEDPFTQYYSNLDNVTEANVKQHIEQTFTNKEGDCPSAQFYIALGVIKDNDSVVYTPTAGEVITVTNIKLVEVK